MSLAIAGPQNTIAALDAILVTECQFTSQEVDGAKTGLQGVTRESIAEVIAA